MFKMIEMYLKKTLTGLIPTTKDSNDKYEKLKLNEEVKAKITQPNKRVLGFHKKFFALLDVSFEHRPERLDGINKEAFRKEVICRAGYYTLHTNFKGFEVYEAKSIAFNSMKQPEFEELYNRVMDIIIKYVLDGSKTEEVERAVLGELNGF
jgi:hypothetical protein